MRRLGAAPRRAGAPPLRMVDVGTGSGAIAIALASALRGVVPSRRSDPRRRHLAGCARPRAGERGRPRVARPDPVRGRRPAARTGRTARPSTSSWPTCRTSATTRWPTCRWRRPSSRRSPSTGEPDGLEVIGRLLDRLPRGRWPTAASRSSRSARTRAQAIVGSSRRGCRAGPAASSWTWRACPRVAVMRAEARRLSLDAPARAAAHLACPAEPTFADPPDRPRHRRDAGRRRPGRRAADGRRGPRGDGARRRRLAGHRPDGLERDAVRARARADRPIVGYQGGLIRAMPAPGSDPARQAAGPHAAAARDVARESWRGRGRTGSTRTSTTSSGSSSAPTTRAPTTTRRSWARGRAVPRPASRRSTTRSPRSSRSASRRCPTELAPLAARPPSPVAADVTISHPRFLEFVAPGVSKGRAIRWLARRLGVPLGADARRRRPVERHRDAGRGRARRGDADRPGRGPGGRALPRPAVADEGVAE